MMKLLKNILILFCIMVFAFTATYFLLLQFHQSTFPTPEGKKISSFTWEHENKTLSFSLPVYKSIYDWYEDLPSDIYMGSEIESFKNLTSPHESDAIISNLKTSIKILASQNGMTPDETSELAVSFVQSLDYDYEKAIKGIRSYRYPYQVLYDKKGICSEKSFLLAALLKKMGYGTAIFHFSEQRHMGVGIETVKEYSNYNSGFCYIETTKKFPVGTVPEKIITETGVVSTMSSLDQWGQEKENTISLGNPEVYPLAYGKKYTNIVKRKESKEKLIALQETTRKLKNQIDQTIAQLEDKQDRLNMLRNFGHTDRHIERYSVLSEKYNKRTIELRELISEYNKTVELYNNLLADTDR